MSETKTVFVTKYALTEGIEERFVDRFCEDDCVAAMLHPKSTVAELFYPGDWHLTREAAVSRATAMRDAKIASLDQQIARLRGIGFD